MAPTNSRFLLLAVVALGALPGCGGDTTAPAIDASAPPIDALVPEDTGVDSSAPAIDAGLDAVVPAVDSGIDAPMCTLAGEACEDAAECCSGLCEDTVSGARVCVTSTRDGGGIVLLDGGAIDAGSMIDGGSMIDSGAPMCVAAIGRVGGACRAGACLAGLECLPELLVSGGAELTFRNAFGIGQGVVAADGEVDPVAVPVPGDDVELAWPADVCSEQCDVGAPVDASGDDMCGECAHCYQGLGEGSQAQSAFGIDIGTYLSSSGADLMYGARTGACRFDCEFDPETNGGCPTGYTCHAWHNVCVEACESDAQCSSFAALARDGSTVVAVDRSLGQTCNATTGRCDWAAPATGGAVGDTCEGNADCAADVGACMNGGTCAATQCDPASVECADGAGLCLGTGGNAGTLCLAGCITSDDCNPGSACQPLELPPDVAAMTEHDGFCLGGCDVIDTPVDVDGDGDLDPDQLVPCRVDERCDMEPATATSPDPIGQCRASCTPDAAGGPGTGCASGETCEAVSGESYGFCRVLGALCLDISNAGAGNQDGDDTCFAGQLCDRSLGIIDRGGSGQVFDYGRCRTACDAPTSPTVCTGGQVCDTGSHLCRTRCGAGLPACAVGSACSSAGFCEQQIPCDASRPCPRGACTRGFCAL